MEDEKTRGTGALHDPIDSRDFQWGEEIGFGAPSFDWEKGYDVEEDVSTVLGKPFKVTVKDQNGSSSCGGQAWSYLGEVLDTLNDKAQQEKSAKFIYSQTFVGTGGSAGRTNCDLCVNKGWGNEVDCSSYESGKPPSETFMERKSDITTLAFTNALKDRGLSYTNALKDRGLSYANVSLNMDMIAQAVRDNHGCIFGLTGKNNGTWTSTFPKPPEEFSGSWNHWVLVGKAKIINGKKYFGILNSWGKEVGEAGWQWLSEDYVMHKISGNPVIWSIWTMVAKKDEEIIIPDPLTKTLRYGMVDSEVKLLQMKLQRLGYFPSYVNTTLYFGSITLGAVKSFQKAHGLIADGIVGSKTRAVINNL